MSYNKKLGIAESSGKYNAENTIGYLGKYQMGASALQDLGYVNPKPKGISQKEWLNKEEAWTGKNGITSKQDFLMNGNEQEEAQTGWNNLLDKRTKSLGLDKYIGKEMNGVTLTNDMIRGMAHLAGHGNVKKALASGDLTSWKDAYGTTMLNYANKFKEDKPMQSKKPNAYTQFANAALLDRENGTGVTYSNTKTRPLMDEPTNNTGKEYGYSGGGKDWATSRGMGGVPEGVTLPKEEPTKESKPALVVDEGTFEGMPDIEYEAQEVGEPVQSPLAKSVDQGMTEITPDGQEQEVAWWVRPAQGLFSGLRDFGMTLLQTGGDYNAAAAAGMDSLLRPLDSEYRERQDQLQRKQYVTKLVDSGKLDPAKADAYIKTGNTSYLEQSQTLNPSDQLAYLKYQDEKNAKAQEVKSKGSGMYQESTKMLNLVNSINDDDIANAGGLSSIGGAWTPSSRSSVAKFDQILAAGFMQNIQQMKGMGALSNAEGSKVTAAATALVDPETNQMRTGLSEDFIKKQLNIIRDGANRMQKIGQFYETNGREPTISELESFGVTETKQPVKVQVNPRTGQRREVYSDGSFKLL